MAKKIDIYTPQYKVCDVIKKYLNSNFDNHTIHQYEFVTDELGKIYDDVKILKFGSRFKKHRNSKYEYSY